MYSNNGVLLQVYGKDNKAENCVWEIKQNVHKKILLISESLKQN